MYDYKATVLKVIDGDTVDVRVDLGFDSYQDMRIRLNGIDAPELHAKVFLAGLVEGKEIRLLSIKDSTEKYGRYLGEIYTNWKPMDAYNPSVSQQMIDAGHAVPYSGGKR